MRTIPPYLKKGDTIGIVAPAGFMAIEKMQTCMETLDSWGFTIRMGTTTHSNSQNYFSGSDDERLDDIQKMLDDPEIKAILCARGGYGVSRIIDRISFKKFRKHPKWIVGFSDITVLHSHIFSRYKIATLHAPMAAAFNEGEIDNPYILSLKQALTGEATSYKTASHHYNRAGHAEGVMVGGNLSLLSHLIGSRSDINTKGKILFLEDIGEYLYNIDRMMIQMKRSGKLDQLSALIIGRFTENKDTEQPFGSDVYDIIYDHVKEYDYPLCFHFPISHDKENYAVKIGVEYALEVGEGMITLSEKS